MRRRRNPGPPPKELHRVNERIRIRSVFLIDEEGTQVGEVPTPDALRMAQERGLDLVEVAANQRPPVCRIMDYGKFKYQQKKKQVASKKKQHTATIKEVRVRPKIASGDLEVKVKRAREFLEKGDKVQITCLYRGREMAHQDVGLDVMRRFYERIEDIAKIEREPHLEGRRMTMVVTRGKASKSQPKAKSGQEAEKPAPEDAAQG